MSKVELEIVTLYSNQPQTNSFALIMGEKGGNRRLPIIIGHAEAHAIAIETESIKPNRPMTHDLFKTFAHEFGFTLEEVIINDLKEGIFFATLVCSDGQRRVEIDSRPSDAIAIGLRFKVPIFATEHVLSEGGIEVNEEEEMSDRRGTKSTPAAGTVEPGPKKEKLENMSNDRLEEMLSKALEEEDYKKAARIRDILNKRN